MLFGTFFYAAVEEKLCVMLIFVFNLLKRYYFFDIAIVTDPPNNVSEMKHITLKQYLYTIITLSD